MIILQTGVPGSGKTASVVSMLLNDESYTHFEDKDGIHKKRPLFVNGIEDLEIEHQPLFDDQIKEQPLQDFLPYGSLVIIDEAQRLMGTRSAASKVPGFIEALATHRHHGLDIVLITQHPTFLDPFVRKLVQRHMHIRIMPIGRKLFEWNECCEQPDSTVAIGRAVERSFTVPKDAIGKYKSAEVHTKPKRRLPRSLIFIVVFIPLLAFYGLKTFADMKDRFVPDDETTAAVSDAVSDAVSVQDSNHHTVPANAYGGYSSANGQGGSNLTADMFVPTIPERPESKPIYNGIRQVTVFERLAACIEGGKSGCSCYTDQATKIKEIPESLCREYVQDGLPFNPYKQPDQYAKAPDTGGTVDSAAQQP